MKITFKKERGILIPYSEADAEALSKLSDGVAYTVDIKNADMRTIKQNSALHLYCSKIADALNANNLYMVGIFDKEIEWTMELVKTQIVKSLIKKLFDIDSTTKLKRKEIDTLIDTITYIFGLKGVVIPQFPSRELWDENNNKG